MLKLECDICTNPIDFKEANEGTFKIDKNDPDDVLSQIKDSDSDYGPDSKAFQGNVHICKSCRRVIANSVPSKPPTPAEK